MNITFLGTGSAFCTKNYQTNAVVELDSGYKLLVDAGGDVRHAMEDVEMSYLDINGVYISHLHADHIGGLEGLAFATYFDPRYKGRLGLFCSEFLVDDLWNHCLRGGLASLQNKLATIDTYFAVRAVEKNGAFQAPKAYGGPAFNLIQVVHFVDSYTFQFSFGLMFQADDQKVFMTTDTQFAPAQIQDFYNEADVIFHDCETAPFRSGVHAHFDDLTQLDEKTRSKIWLTHFQDNVMTDWDEWQTKAQQAGFHGFVRPQQQFEF